MGAITLWGAALFIQATILASTGWPADLVILTSAESGPYRQTAESFRQHLDPQVRVQEYNLEGRLDRAQDIGERIRAIHPRLVFAIGLKAALVAKAELPDTPTLFSLVVNPEEHGLPADHMIGIRYTIPPLVQLERLRALAPKVRRIGLLYDERKSGTFVADARAQAKKLSLQLLTASVSRREEVAEALQALLPKIDLLWIVQDPTILAEESVDLLIHSALRRKIPAFAFSAALVQRGALGAVLVRPTEIGLQAGRIAEAMLNHRGPSAPALVEPEQPQLALNLNTAEFLGLTPAQSVVQTAGILFGGPGDLAQDERTILQDFLQ